MSGVELLQAFRNNGSEDAFRELVQRYGGFVFSVAKRRLGSDQLAQEVAQDVFVALLRAAGCFKSDGAIAAWLHRTTLNLSIDLWRKETRRRKREEIAMERNAPPDDNDRERVEIARHLDDALNRLSAADREVLLLRFFGGKSMREVGLALGVSEDAGKMRVNRAVGRLRSLLPDPARCSVAALSAILAEHWTEAAPSGLIQHLAALPAAALAPSSFLLLKALIYSGMTKTNISIAIALLACAGTGLFVALHPKHEQAQKAESLQLPAHSTAQFPERRLPASRSASGVANSIPETNAPADAASRSLEVVVRSEQGTPVEAAGIRVTVKGSGADGNFNRTVETSSHGMSLVSCPEGHFDRLELVVSKDGYGSRKVVWDMKTGDEVPVSWAVTLKAGVQVGGFVVDPANVPVAGATVSLGRFWRGGEEMRDKGEQPDFPRQIHVTGPDGRWTARNLPAELLQRISITASHSNYIGVYVSMDAKPEIERALRAQTYRLQLKSGFAVQGIVMNSRGEPVANASVWAGRKFTRERQETRTDAQGRFSFRNVNEGKLDFCAMADGYAPAGLNRLVEAEMKEIVFELRPGSIIRGVIQDEDKQPVEGARVVLEGSPGEDAYDLFEFSTTSAADGSFEWKSAPNESMPFYIGKAGFEQRRGVRLKPAEENVVLLRRSRIVNGLVLDARTAQPITRFRAAPGQVYPQDQFYPESSRITEFKDDKGRFSVNVGEENANAIQVTASGYADQVQSLPSAENGEMSVVFNLQPSPALRGIVVGPDGQPAAGAGVALVGKPPTEYTAQIAHGILRENGSRSKVVHTDEAGAFSIDSPPETGTLAAGNEIGFGFASIEEIRATGKITLLPLGRIEGILVVGTAPAAGQHLMLSWPDQALYFDYASTEQTTDANGRFVFDKVPPGTISIARLVKTSARSSAYSHSKAVEVKPGQVTQVVLGGVNAVVTAQVRFAGAPPEGEYITSAVLSTPLPEPPKNLTPQEQTAYFSSPEWRDQIKARRFYTGAIGRNGRLVLDAIEPGDYTLKVTAVKADTDSFAAKPLATGETTVSVPAGAKPAQPIDIGEIVLRTAK